MKIPRLLEMKPARTNPDNMSDMALLEKKVGELIRLIGRTQVEGEMATEFRQRINEAFDDVTATKRKIAPFQALDQNEGLSREELLENLEKLLAENPLDSKMTARNRPARGLQKGVILIIGLLLITAGFAMIIMPAPPSFEIATVFYFTQNDGVTVMDLFSLLIIFGGVLLIVLNFNKK